MNVFKTMAAICITMVLQASATAQNTPPLIGEWSTEYESVVLKNIKFEGNESESDYKYTDKDEDYVVRVKLELESNDTLKISYSPWSYWDTQTWKRLK